MRNLIERALVEIYDEVRTTRPDACTCEMCRADVLAFALNSARPRYSGGTDLGEALIALDLQRDQTRAALAVIVLDAMRRVAASPRHPQRA